MQNKQDARERHCRSGRHPENISETWFHRHTVFLEIERRLELDVPGPWPRCFRPEKTQLLSARGQSISGRLNVLLMRIAPAFMISNDPGASQMLIHDAVLKTAP
jgi:hypothetical protein